MIRQQKPNRNTILLFKIYFLLDLNLYYTIKAETLKVLVGCRYWPYLFFYKYYMQLTIFVIYVRNSLI